MNGIPLRGLMALVVCAMTICALPAASAEAAKGLNCKPRVWVVGARGSGEKPDHDPGKTIAPFIEKLKHSNPDAVGSEGLGYPAVSVYDWKLLGIGWQHTAVKVGMRVVDYKRSVDEGVDNLVSEVKTRAGICKAQKIVLAGYSQGAQVIRQPLPRLKDVADHVGAVVLFGDPQFDPHTRADKGGTYSDKRHGILGLPDADFPGAFDHVVTYCRDGDLICQGPPNLVEGHTHYAPDMTVGAAVRVADWLGLFQAPTCHPATSISAIIDDSGSMTINDPIAIRRSALELLITKPSSQSKELGAVEFGSEAASIFPPAIVSTGNQSMLAALNDLANDGAADGGDHTDYNAAFQVSSIAQPQANARIFLTDGGHNDEAYEDRHRGGPPTFVIGLNIGPAGQGNDEADLLGRIAAETQGRYFPLVQNVGDDTATQLARLQPALNEIDALINCQTIQVSQQQAFSSAGQRGAPITTKFQRRDALEVVASWPSLGTNLDLVWAAARNAHGKVIADSDGHKRIKGTKRRRAKLVVNRVEGGTFETVTIQRPKGADSLVVQFGAATLAVPVEASIQVRSVAPGTPAGRNTVGGSPTGGSGAPAGGGSGPSGQVAPHPVDAYSNYGSATAGHAMCRGNPGRPESMPGGTLSQTFVVPAGVTSLSNALVQIDPDASVTAHLTLSINGTQRATTTSAASGDTAFSWPAVPVSAGDQATLTISFTATFGKIITIYSAGAVGGTLTYTNTCSDGAPSGATANGLRARVGGLGP
jgi:hypothetical protein